MHDDKKKMHKKIIKSYVMRAYFDHLNTSHVIARFVMLLRTT